MLRLALCRILEYNAKQEWRNHKEPQTQRLAPSSNTKFSQPIKLLAKYIKLVYGEIFGHNRLQSWCSPSPTGHMF